MPDGDARPAGYGWVDDGLRRLGLSFDLRANEHGGALRTDALLEASLALAQATPWVGAPLGVDGGDGRWRAEVGRVAEQPYFVSRTVVRDPARLDRAGFLKFAVDEAITEVAARWDATFRGGAFAQVILRSGEVFRPGERSLAGVPWADVAKVMRWSFAAPGLGRRELLSVYVSHAAAGALTCCYFPVHGAAFPVAPGHVRARLMVPCLDRAEFDGDRCRALIHLASAHLGGLLPDALTTSRFYARTFLRAAETEAAHLTALADGRGPEGDALARARRVDGTLP